MTLYSLTPWPTGAETPNSIFFLETFQPEVMNLVSRYRDGFLKEYIEGEPHLNLIQPVEPVLPEIDASAREIDYYKILSSKFDRDYRLYELQRLEIANIKNAIVSCLDKATQLSLLGDVETIMEMPLPTVYHRIRRASSPRLTDINLVMSRLNNIFSYSQPQSFDNYCIELRKAHAILRQFECPRSTWEYVQMLKNSLQMSQFATDFAPYIAQYEVAHPTIREQNIEELIRLASFAIAGIEAKIIAAGIDRSSLQTVQVNTATAAPPAKQKKRYCHTHGTNVSHSSNNCKYPGPTHDTTATFKDQKGGKPSA